MLIDLYCAYKVYRFIDPRPIQRFTATALKITNFETPGMQVLETALARLI